VKVLGDAVLTQIARELPETIWSAAHGRERDEHAARRFAAVIRAAGPVTPGSERSAAESSYQGLSFW
jgi:hypothetical protein